MSDVSEETAANEPPAQSSQTRWAFIDASNNSRSNLTRVKRHVMQEYMRQKRGGQPQPDNENGESVKEKEESQPKVRRRPRNKSAEKSTTEKEKKDRGKSRRRKSPDASTDTRQEVESMREDSLGEGSSTGIGESHVLVAAGQTKASTLVSVSTSDLPKSYASGDQSSNSGSDSRSPLSSAPTTPYELTLSPKSILSAARTDPFNTLPMDLDAEGRRLFDFYVNEMPACSYGNHFRSPKAHNWYTAVFVPEGMKGPVAFQNTILVHAANTWAWVRNEEETKMTLVHRNRAISMLREHLAANPGDISDVAIIACLSAAGLEDFDPRPGRKQISWIHMRAAREMIRARGGPAAFENTRLGMLINWQDYILSGYETHGPSFFFEPNPPIPSPPDVTPMTSRSEPSLPTSSCLSTDFEGVPSTAPTFSPRDELQHQCNEFIEFLKRCEQLALHQQSHTNPAIAPMRHTAFQPTSLLYQILAAPPGVRFTASGNRKQFVARLVALIMFNAGLWDYRSSIAHSETFLRTLEQAVLESEVNMSGSVEALLQIMLECNDGTATASTSPDLPSAFLLDELELELELEPASPDFTQYSPTARTPYGRPWFAGRMLKVAKRLGYETWMRVSDFLLGCLTLQVWEGSVAGWEGALRQEILSAPLTSYVMPALR
ncbi:sigma-70 region 2 family protein [Aspergillus novofumigatus IBT 16806]|uniref:Sigma-70 region 2 family protein n=1 Tax=Aspergillus novofumigatus (strain IBT 16806) TaxID=1392255 RepID=A0A2I1C3R4_ASPN1|nr:sigma-70 region 2 family protein [Aspergillus novofumigatus IBT 16806]PKX92221.1 sigma-70 region 2 family protein [Aspergillus novofumigatus IBT 16806]